MEEEDGQQANKEVLDSTYRPVTYGTELVLSEYRKSRFWPALAVWLDFTLIVLTFS